MATVEPTGFSDEGPFLLVEASTELLSGSAGRSVMLRLRGPALHGDMPAVEASWLLAEAQVEYLVNVLLRVVAEADGAGAAYWLLTRLWEHVENAE